MSTLQPDLRTTDYSIIIFNKLQRRDDCNPFTWPGLTHAAWPRFPVCRRVPQRMVLLVIGPEVPVGCLPVDAISQWRLIMASPRHQWVSRDPAGVSAFLTDLGSIGRGSHVQAGVADTNAFIWLPCAVT